jgi:hypothetical protein
MRFISRCTGSPARRRSPGRQRAGNHVAFLEVDEAVRDLAQGQRVGGEEMLADADADHQGAAGAGRDHLVRVSTSIAARA